MVRREGLREDPGEVITFKGKKRQIKIEKNKLSDRKWEKRSRVRKDEP